MARWTEERIEELRRAVASNRSLAGTLRTLGLRAAGGNFRTIRVLIERHQIPVDHFDPHASNRTAGRRRRRPIEELLVQGSTTQRWSLKRRLYEEGLKERRCELCGQGELWHGRQMSLVLDHVNGIHDDNRLENLRIVCANCNATLDTHCGRNNRKPPETRRCEECDREYTPSHRAQRFCSRRCGARRSTRGLRRVERPPLGILLRELEESGFSAVGRKYGVSDNAIRKWVRAYEREAAA